ncbi:unnamed protein product [Cochlearia groenlandica]
MNYLYISCLFLLFFFSLFNPLTCVSSKLGIGLCESQFKCGNITSSFPFWGGDRPKLCGHPLLELRCIKNITYLNISNYDYKVYHIDQQSNTIRLARKDQLGSFCDSRFNTTTSFPDIFELSPIYKRLNVLYNCDSTLSYPSSYSCPNLGLFSISQNLDYQYYCQDSFTVNVPSSFLPEERELDVTHLESVLRKGFEIRLMIDEKACQKCSSSGGICSFNSTTQICCNINSPSGGVSCVQQQPSALCLLVGVIAIVVLLCPCFGVQIFRKRKTADERRLKKLKALIPLKHYTYKQVKKMTKSFAEVVGKGGFGIVYKGTLRDGRMVAVKVLKDSKGNGEDFINEVASMSQTSHVNIVSLLGFCSEGSKRAIIYEFLRNGSLDKIISHKTSTSMDLTTLYSVSLGVARGLDYLHFGCKTRIVHFDIKPQNVLLDENFCPKVSDFGLAKLCDNKESIMSLLETRGTIGYIAPEMISRIYGSISHKSDVYSYGMLVLEMIGARKKENFDQNSASATSTMYFPEWIYRDLEKEENGKLIKNEINIEEEEIARKMTLVGLWCIQSSPSNRPTMNKVVEMMEGNSDALDVPPRPVLQEISAATHYESSHILEESSSAFEVLICSTN